MNSLYSEQNERISNPYESFSADKSGEGPMTAERPASADVFRYEDYRSFLRDRFAALQNLDPAFSQRGLARKAGIANPGFFNEVIKGRRRLSPAAALKMATGLDLTQDESEYFSSLVDFAEARESQAKLDAGKRMSDLLSRREMPSQSEHPQAL